MTELDNLYYDIEQHIDNLKTTFLDPHLKNKLSEPSDYDFNVKSFCILSHAAFEDVFESISLIIMKITINNYIYEKKVSDSLVALMHFIPDIQKGVFDNDETDNNLEKIYDYFRICLTEINDKFSKLIFNNQGMSLKYLKQILLPVAINIPDDVKLLSSVRQLSVARGSYAHKFKEKGIITKSLSPEDAYNTVSDCLQFCKIIIEEAKTKLI